MLPFDPHTRRSVQKAPGTLAAVLGLMLALLAFATPATAQLNGTYTIGGSAPSFGTIDAAVTALNGGVSGPVTFLIRSGTYVPPVNGWRLISVGGLSAVNTVTFKPDANATVTLTGNTGSFNTSGVFNIDGGRYYIIDGSNSAGGTSKDMTIIQTEVNYNAAIIFKNNADFNVVKNCNLQSNASSAFNLYGYGTVYFAQGTGNDNNTVQNCVIGDPNAVNRGYVGVGFFGNSVNSNNAVIGCDIINFRYAGVYIDGSNSGVTVQKNLIHMTAPSTITVTYGIYCNENGTAQNIKIDSNKIYKLLPAFNPSASVYGIFMNHNNVPSGTAQITNNMISLTENGYISYYGIALQNNMSLTATSYTTNIYFNSVFFGGTAESFGGTYPLYRYSYSSSGLGQTTVNHRNNIYYSLRSGGNTTSYGLYVYSSPTGGFNSDYNLISLNTDNNYYTAYYNFSLYQTLASYKTSGQDANSVGINPQFVDPFNGDLHISTTRRTGVESRGTSLAGLGFTTDFDGNVRNTPPDIGADEGTFLGPLSIDAAADRFHLPAPNAVVRANTSFSPVAWVTNSGTTSQTIPIRFRILNSGGAVVYNDLWNYVINPLLPQRVTFSVNGNNGGSTSLPVGTYTMELSTSLAGDGDATNNTITATLYVKDPLNGVYTIDKNGSGPRNYTSFAATGIDLSSVGMSGPVTFNIASGTYDSTSETFPIRFKAISGANASNRITYKPAPGATVTMSASLPGSQLIDFADADYITFDGSNGNNGGTSRDWKIANTGVGPAVRFYNAAQYNTLTNLYLLAANTTTSGVVYFGGYGGTASGTSYNAVRNNTIGDSTGNLRSFTNVYLTGDFSYRNIGNIIEGNDIINWGANINNGGYGVYGGNYANELKIFRNRFRQTAIGGTTSFSGCYAIYISNFYNTNDSIAYNTITDLATQTPLSTQMGIYFASLGQATAEVVHSNMITLTQDLGNMYGVYIGTGSPSTFLIDHNSISIRGRNTSGSNYLSTALRTASSSNVTMRNNIMMNERTFPSGTGNYVLYRGSSAGVFSSNNNILYAGGAGTAIGYNFGTTLLTLPQWQGMGYDGTSTTSLPPFVNQAAGDLHINPVPIYRGEGQGLALGYQRDVDMQARDMVAPDIGADDGDFNGGGIVLFTPNGGETFAPNDVVTVNYTTNRVMGVRFELSLDGGATWTTIGTQNTTLKGGNATNVTIPDTAANAARFRVISQRNMYEADTADAPFRIVRKLKVMAANGGEEWYVGDTSMIRWDRRPGEGLVDYIDIEYSSDGGTNWQRIAAQVPMYTDSLPWVVPNTPTNNALIRLSNREVARFWDSSDAVFSIYNPSLRVVTPNGGERYEMEQPVTVTWNSQNVTRLALLYSSDNGNTWQTIATDVAAGDGSYTFTPIAIPTRLGLVRLIDMDRPRIKDQSDLTFEIMESKSIAVYTPSAGDKLVRNSTTVITWDAPRINSVNILFSTNAGSNWQTIASNVLASEGSRVWTVPNLTTNQGMIRIQEVGGPTIGESSIFSIIDPVAPTITVIAPNGGEQYVGGDEIPIRWSASDVNTVTLSISDNNGVSWNLIQAGVAANSGQFMWIAPDVAGSYLVKVSSGNPVASDVSNAVFTITKKLQPRITVLYPDGGENLTIDSTVQIRWTAQDISGNVKIELRRTASSTWDSIAAAPASSGNYAWKVVGPVTTEARVRVIKPGLGIADTSNADFEISQKVVESIVVVAPNGGEIWQGMRMDTIRWTAPSSVTSVDIAFSPDGGVNWVTVLNDVPSTGTNPFYAWLIPNPPATISAALVRISDHAGVAQSDISNNVFTVRRDEVGGVTGPVTGLRGLSLLGNYPNPFAGTTELRWHQGVASDVEIRIYQQSGALVSRTVVGRREGGEQRYVVNGADLASGAYIYEIRAGQEVARGVMMLVR